jgi:hypothetical protein
MTTKKIELRKISYSASLSEETNAYTAQVWVDGVHVCDVSNHGTGGPDEQHPARGKTYADVQALNDYCKATYPKETYNFGGDAKGEYEVDLEHLCGQLLTAHLIERDLRRSLKAKVLFTKKGTEGVYQISLKKVAPAQYPQFFKIIREKNNADLILNEMPFDQALDVFKRTAA